MPRPTRRSALKTATGGLAALLTAGVLSSCSTGGPEPVRFTFNKREAIDFFTTTISDYNGSQDTYEVVMDNSGPASISASFVRGNPPDLMLARYGHEVSRFVQRCTLSDLSDTEIASTISPNMQPLLDQFGSCEGRTTCLPYSAMAASIVYNKQIFAEHDLVPPTTWSDLIEVCETLKAAGVAPFYATFAAPWTVGQGWFDYAVGGSLDVAAFYSALASQGAETGPDSPVSFEKDFLAPVEKMQQLARDYTQPDANSRIYDFGNVEFAKGGGAMYMQGPWAMSEIAQLNPDLEMGSFPLPMTEDPADLKVVTSIDLATMIPEDAHNPEGARDFLAYLYRPEVIQAYNAEQLGFVPTVNGEDPTDPRIQGMVDFYKSDAVYLAPGQINPPAIPTNSYAQSLVLGADAATTLRAMDADWARIAFRQPDASLEGAVQ